MWASRASDISTWAQAGQVRPTPTAAGRGREESWSVIAGTRPIAVFPRSFRPGLRTARHLARRFAHRRPPEGFAYPDGEEAVMPSGRDDEGGWPRPGPREPRLGPLDAGPRRSSPMVMRRPPSVE